MRKTLVTAVLVLAMVLGFSAAAMAASVYTPNPDVNGSGIDLNQTLSGDVVTGAETINDNGVVNANNTGSGINTNDGSKASSVIKNVTGQRTHGSYQNNTNSCASCHQTHTAAGQTLLFKDGVYDSCTACHDGTLGFYNVFAASTAGTFNGGVDGSIHMANDALKVSAAPGGNHTSTDAESWGKNFDCASCHSPHGSYSSRLLNYNPNDMGTEPSWEGGIAAWSKVYDYADVSGLLTTVQAAYNADNTYEPKNTYGKYILVRGTKDELGITGGGTTKAIVTYTFSVDHGTWSLVKDQAPMIYGYEYYSPYKWYVTKLFALTPAELTTDADNNRVPDKVDALPKPYTATEAGWVLDQNDSALKFDNQNGIITDTDNATLDTITYGQVARAYVTKLEMRQYPGADLAANQANENFAPGGMFSYVSALNLATNDNGGVAISYSNDQGVYKNGAAGKGKAVSQYCAACHTDYLANSGKKTGTWDTNSYRHTTEADSYACIRCHFAHGTDQNTLKDAQGRDYVDLTSGATPLMDAATAANWLDDKNTSSALKKFTNMSGCWSCHQNSHAESLINNPDGTDANRAVNDDWANEAPVSATAGPVLP